MAALRGLLGKLPTGLIGAAIVVGGAAYGVSEAVFTGKNFNVLSSSDRVS